MLELLTTGQMSVPGFAFGLSPAAAIHKVPITVAVLVRADGSVVLVDTGLSRREIEAPIHAFGAQGLVLRVDCDGSGSLVDQLERRGLDRSTVTTIIATHLHLDHLGGFVDFPNAEIIVTAAELAAARRLGLRAGYVHVAALTASGRVRPILFDRAPRHGFPGHLDLFGDGQVVLLDARGHTAGSTAILLTDPVAGRTVLHAGDAAYSPNEYRTRSMSPLARFTRFRESWLRETWGHLRAFESAHPGTPVVLSHDPASLTAFPQRHA